MKKEKTFLSVRIRSEMNAVTPDARPSRPAWNREGERSLALHAPLKKDHICLGRFSGMPRLRPATGEVQARRRHIHPGQNNTHLEGRRALQPSDMHHGCFHNREGAHPAGIMRA